LFLGLRLLLGCGLLGRGWCDGGAEEEQGEYERYQAAHVDSLNRNRSIFPESAENQEKNVRGTRPGPHHTVMNAVEHISEHELERYHLGMVQDERELAALEEHLLSCGGCVERASLAADYVDAVRAAACERGD
jgi:hypothetical protein